MSHARNTFLSRLKSFSISIAHETLVSQAPNETEHNSRARLLRNGLCVVAFAMLEDFLKCRTAEILQRISNAPVPFDRLPPKIRKAATFGAVKALDFQMQMRQRQGEDTISFVQDESSVIASTGSGAFGISRLSLGQDRSNLGQEDVKQMLTTFYIKDPWRQIDVFASRVGASSPSLMDAFRNAATRRHLAAHSATADTELSDLHAFAKDAIAIAIGFDALLSLSVRKILSAETEYLEGNQRLEQDLISVRYINNYGANDWREFTEIGDRAVRRYASREDGIAGSLARAQSTGGVLVSRDQQRIPTDWLTIDSM